MAAYLAQHVPHLQSLHVQLGLPAEALKSDEETIEAAIRDAVTTLIRNREKEVDGWKEAISRARGDLAGVAQAIGSADGADSTAKNDLALPQQHERLLQQRTDLERVYAERLQQIESLRTQLDALATLLGPPVEPPQPLETIASSSRIDVSSTSRRRSSLRGSARRSIIREGKDETSEEAWLDVRDEVGQRLQVELQRAIEERETRLQTLYDHFRDLLFFHVELAIPPLSSAGTSDMPDHLMPPIRSPRRRSVQEGYMRLLARYIDANASAMSREDAEEETWSKGLEEVEPERSLMSWLQEMVELWMNERDSRIAQIQGLYDKLEPLWLRLEVEQDQQDLFIEMNRGCGETVIRAYEAELERCLELRRSSLSLFVVSIRAEMEGLWDELMMSDDERGQFGPFIDDDYSEELLTAHEEEVERLKEELESKGVMLPKVREWHALKAEEEELEKLASDPNRFSRRGGALLREEKLRKRVGTLLPRVENDLLTTLPAWEEATGRAFMVNGERVIDVIFDIREAKEAAKEAKKRQKQGLAPTTLAPSKTVRATPATLSKRGVPGSVLSRKRDAPTPTPMSFTSASKKPRLGGLGGMTSISKGQTRIPSNSGRKQDPSSSPTPASQLPRLTAKPNARMMGRRESFIPRQSVIGGSRGGMTVPREQWGVQEEDEEGVC